MRFDLSRPFDLTFALAPDLLLMAGAMILLLATAWGAETPQRQRAVGRWSIVLCVLTLAGVIYMWVAGHTAARGVVAVDAFRWATDVLVLLGAILAIAMSMDYLERERIDIAEAHVLILFATAGMMLLAAARDLMIVFLGIELMSIAVYVLAGLNRRSLRSAEAALKYFLLGAFSTGFLLYGIALVFGATGSTNIADIGAAVLERDLATNPMLLAGVGLLIVGLGFKVAAAPFHMWTPDVYEGAPTPMTAFMAAAVKAAAFATFLRMWMEAFPYLNLAWHKPLWYLAVVTMVVGNVVALMQKNVKRMLAYSSIAHAGYLLVAVVVSNFEGASAFLFYVFAYTLATMGAFAVVMALAQTGERGQQIEDYAGLWRVRPGLAIAMAVFMLALLGFPIFGGMGFFAKWYVIQAALRPPSQPKLAVWLVLTSVVSAGYYLYVVMVMFMKARPADAPAPLKVPGMTRFVIATCAIVLLVVGIWPRPVLSVARRSLPQLVHLTEDVPRAPTTQQ
ncbi:MAG TPA: NADH-quinone oxidoreductase subunit N [Gemmatimonadaceae bacterium]|nr:NADH-quinone oxidoreductase subunit N [Gemmatimonadaceae bacterium]